MRSHYIRNQKCMHNWSECLENTHTQHTFVSQTDLTSFSRFLSLWACCSKLIPLGYLGGRPGRPLLGGRPGLLGRPGRPGPLGRPGLLGSTFSISWTWNILYAFIWSIRYIFWMTWDLISSKKNKSSYLLNTECFHLTSIGDFCSWRLFVSSFGEVFCLRWSRILVMCGI